MKKFQNKVIAGLISSIIVLSLISSLTMADSNQRWNLGTVTNTGKDNGYSGSNSIDLDDPHYGWSLGQFYVSGFTQHTTDADGDVFLKNVGDQVELHFELLQDIDSLNGEDNLTIYADSNGYDQYFGTQRFNDCRGLLIIRKTDYQNATADPIVYTNYLDGVSAGADTVVELCEEGDYEVALDYEIEEKHYGVSWNTYVGVPTYTNYRIFFTFKIRNGNCMVFPFDVANGTELTNESFTDNGFYLDLANSRYLDINVQRAVYTEGANGYTQDVRFNRPASDGTQYTDEGVYTITVHNNYTNESTTKTIYVGTDPMMRAYVVTGYSLDEIQDLVEDGYQITEEGTMVPPDGSGEVIGESENVASDTTGKEESSSDRSGTKTKRSIAPVLISVLVVIILVVAGVFVYLKKDKLFKIKGGSKISGAAEVKESKTESNSEERPSDEGEVE